MPEPAPTLQSGEQLDWNIYTEEALLIAAGSVPVAGSFLTHFVKIMWKATHSSDVDVWQQIEKRVSALISSEITANNIQQRRDLLATLQGQANDYLNTLAEAQKDRAAWSDVHIKLGTTISSCVGNQHMFTERANPQDDNDGMPACLLSQFVQFVNLLISLYRDEIALAEHFEGYTAEVLDQKRTDLRGFITSSQKHVAAVVPLGRDKAAKQGQVNAEAARKATQDSTGRGERDHHIEPFKTTNAYERILALEVFAFSELWQFLTPGNTEKPRPYEYTLWSDPYGTADETDIRLDEVRASEFPDTIVIYYGDRIDAMELWYPTNAPRRQPSDPPSRKTDLMGRRSSSDRQENVPITPADPVAAAWVRFGDVVMCLNFRFQSGKETGRRFGLDSGGSEAWVEYSGHALREIKIMGTSGSYGSANCIAFGFARHRT